MILSAKIFEFIAILSKEFETTIERFPKQFVWCNKRKLIHREDIYLFALFALDRTQLHL